MKDELHDPFFIKIIIYSSRSQSLSSVRETDWERETNTDRIVLLQREHVSLFIALFNHFLLMNIWSSYVFFIWVGINPYFSLTFKKFGV